MKKYTLLIISLIILDQLTKLLVIQTIPNSTYLTLLPNFLSLTYLKNSGMFFGMLFQNNNAIVVITLIIVCILFVAFYLFQTGKLNSKLSKLQSLSFSFILSGAISNISDRIFHTAVIDFISLDIINFPIFNLADCFITAGAIILTIDIFKTDNRQPSAKRAILPKKR
jgi:signal peptidase II